MKMLSIIIGVVTSIPGLAMASPVDLANVTLVPRANDVSTTNGT
jgi:hypothetical protein